MIDHLATHIGLDFIALMWHQIQQNQCMYYYNPYATNELSNSNVGSHPGSISLPTVSLISGTPYLNMSLSQLISITLRII